MQAFPRELPPQVLLDIAKTYEAVWESINAAFEAEICSSTFIHAQAGRLRELADRVGTEPTDWAIRAEADVFDRKARRASRSVDSFAAQYIRKQCHLRFAAATIASRHHPDAS